MNWQRFEYIVEQCRFVIEHLKVILLTGIVAWTMIVLTLHLTHVINLELECQDRCMKVIDWVIHSASAETLNSRPPAPFVLRLALLPDR